MKLYKYLKSKYSKSTAKRYQRDSEILKKDLVNHETATYKDLTIYLGALRKRHKNPQHINAILAGIKSYYQFLVDTGKRDDHPCRYLVLKDRINRDVQLQDLFTRDELEKLMHYKERYEKLEYRNKAVISLLIYQALTSGEILHLKTSDIDLEKGEITIYPRGKLNDRTLPLKPQQIMLFNTYIEDIRPEMLRIPTEQLIVTLRGTGKATDSISHITERYKYLFEDRKLTPITIRQSVITNLLKEGNDIRVVQHFAGHKTPGTTEKYKQRNLKALQEAILKYHPLG